MRHHQRDRFFIASMTCSWKSQAPSHGRFISRERLQKVASVRYRRYNHYPLNKLIVSSKPSTCTQKDTAD
jgi:hypothetical protein